MDGTVKFASMYYLLLSSIPLLFVFYGILAVIPFSMYLTFMRMGFLRTAAVIFVSVVFLYSIYFQMGLLDIRTAGILILLSGLLGLASYWIYSRYYETVNLLFAGTIIGYFLSRGGGALSALITALLVWWLAPCTYALFVLFASLFFASFYFVRFAIKHYRKPDPRRVTIDEVLGMMILLIFVPHQLPHVLAGWALFELLDVTKVFPINIFDRVKGEGGVILDDVVAGVMGAMIWMLAEYYLPWL